MQARKLVTISLKSSSTSHSTCPYSQNILASGQLAIDEVCAVFGRNAVKVLKVHGCHYAHPAVFCSLAGIAAHTAVLTSPGAVRQLDKNAVPVILWNQQSAIACSKVGISLLGSKVCISAKPPKTAVGSFHYPTPTMGTHVHNFIDCQAVSKTALFLWGMVVLLIPSSRFHTVGIAVLCRIPLYSTPSDFLRSDRS